MAIAKMVNRTPARTSKPGAKQNKAHKPGAAKRNKAKRAAKNTSTAVARRTTPSPATVKKIEQNARKTHLAELRSKGVLQNKGKKKKGKRRAKRRNGGGLMSMLPSMPNPSFRGIAGTLKTGAFIVAGGGASTILAALMLAVLDKVAPTWAAHRYAQTVATAIAAIVALPLILSVRVFNFMGSDGRTAATWGGVAFSLGQGFNELTGKDVFSSHLGDEIVGGIRNTFPSTGNAQADAAARAVLAAGGTQQQAAAAQANTMRGMRGAAPLNFSPRGASPMGTVSKAY